MNHVDAIDVAILDDDDDYSNLLRLHLQNAGVTAEISTDPSVFLEQYEQKPARVCLFDLNMADTMGVRWRFAGVGTLVAFRKRYGDSAKVAIVTGMLNPTLIEACENAGADAFLRKDTPLPEIVSRVQELLRATAEQEGRRKTA